MPDAPKRHRPVGYRPRPTRPTAAQRGYDSKWRAASRAFLAAHPTCHYCGDPIDLSVPGEGVVDHDPPHRGDKRAFWDSSTWRPAHKRCHDSKTGRGG